MSHFQFDLTYFLILALGLFFYLSISFVLNKHIHSEIKLMRILRDPKSAARNRKQIDNSIESSEKETKLILFWPVLLAKGLYAHVKKKIDKKE